MELIKKNQYIISKTERIGLKRKTLELDIGLKICTFFQKQTAKALTNLKSQTSSYEKRQTKPALVKGVFATMSCVAGWQIVMIELTCRVLLKISNITGT